MPTFFDRAALLVLAYLAGSFPTGVVIGHLRGVDVRAIGSGNIGATNVARAMGSRMGVYTLVVDALKGFLPTLAALWIMPSWPWVSFVALATVAGHCFSIFLDFKGGKGVATSAGVFLALAPFATLCAAIVWLAILLFTRVSSFGAFAALPTLLLLLLLPGFQLLGFTIRPARSYLPLGIAIAAIVLYRHKDNLKRALEGGESRFSRPSA